MPEYIHIPFEQACRQKWESGVREYRQNPDDEFNGEPLEESYQETLDLFNLLTQAEKQYAKKLGYEDRLLLAIAKRQVMSQAEMLQRLRSRLTG